MSRTVEDAARRHAERPFEGVAASAATLGAEIDRMKDIIAHQLKRAAASGGALLGQAPIDVMQVAVDLRAALLKVYAGKDLSIELVVERESQFVGDRGISRNCWVTSSIMPVSGAESRAGYGEIDPQAGSRERLSLAVEDDGTGISEENRARVLERGVRTDESVPGHGLGLAMVHDTVDLYGGSLSIDASSLGGARFSLTVAGAVGWAR